MSTESYGDVVALSLVLVSAILIAVFVWLMMRKYRMEMHQNDLDMAPKLASPPVETPPAPHFLSAVVGKQATADREASISSSQTAMKAIPLENIGAGQQADGSGADGKKKPPTDIEMKQSADDATKPSADNTSKASADETNLSAAPETKPAAESKRKQKDGSKLSRRNESRRASCASGERSSTIKRRSKRRRSTTALTDTGKPKAGDESSVTPSSRLDKVALAAAEMASTPSTRDATTAPTTAACDVSKPTTVADETATSALIADQTALPSLSTAKPPVGHGAGVPSAVDGASGPAVEKFDIVGSPVVCGGLSSAGGPTRSDKEPEHVQSFLTALPGVFSTSMTSPELRSTAAETQAPAPDEPHQKQPPTNSSASKDPSPKPSTAGAE